MRARSQSYLDFNAGAPLHPSVMEALQPFSRLTGNPSSIHAFGQDLGRHIRKAKQQILNSLSQGSRTDEGEIVFSGSGTEATQWVWDSIKLSAEDSDHLKFVCSQIEHKATLDTASRYEKCGYEITQLGVDENGELLEFSPRDNTAYSFHWVNNEIGVIWPIAEIIKKIKSKKNTWVHIDGCQAWGKIPQDLTAIGADFITFSAHKIGGLPGLGITWMNPKTTAKFCTPKTGTLNVFGILACAEASKHLPSRDDIGLLAHTQKEFESELKKQIPGVKINGEKVNRVANTTHLTIQGLKKQLDLVMLMDLAGFAVSAGSACSSGILEASHVVKALGYQRSDAIHSLRVSYGTTVERDDLLKFAAALQKATGTK